MTANLPTATASDAESTVQTAATTFLTPTARCVPPTDLVQALLTLERQAKQSKQTISPEVLLGTWRLCFSAGKGAKFQSGKPTGSGFYIPKLAIAHISFSQSDSDDAPLAIANTLKVGPLRVRFMGPARCLGKKNLLAFDFTQIQIDCWGASIYQGKVGQKKRAGRPFAERPVGELPFFAFFAASEDYIAARGRGGGVALWAKSRP